MIKSPDHSFAYFYFQSMVFLVSPPNMVGIPYIPQIFDFFCLKQHSHLCPLKNAFTSATQHLSLTSAPDSMEDACPVLTSYLPRIKSNDFSLYALEFLSGIPPLFYTACYCPIIPPNTLLVHLLLPPCTFPKFYFRGIIHFFHFSLGSGASLGTLLGPQQRMGQKLCTLKLLLDL